MSTCKAYIKWRKSITACKVQCQLRGWLKLQWSHQDIKINCFTVHGGTLSAFIGIRICAMPCGMWNTHWRWSHWIYTKRRKWITDATFGKNNWFEIVTIRLDNAENQSSGWLLRKPTVRAKCVEVGTRINMTQCVNDHPFVEPSVWWYPCVFV